MFIIDFKQAFDRINTDYICQVFIKFGFGETFIRWLKTIFSNRQSCVKNGGHISKMFQVQSGVKQGCSLAPLLFILAAEILAQNIIQDEQIKGVKYPRSDAQLKIYQFADDTSFLCQSAIDIKEILSRLKQFSLFSGLSINIDKCVIMPMGNNQNYHADDIEKIKITHQVKVVGIHFRSDRCASHISKNWEERVTKIRNIVKSWMKRKLTVIGKIQVIKTFLLSQLVFLFQSIFLPSEVLDEINTIFYRFIWKKENIDNKAWERLSRKVLSNDKNNGGLDMINVHDFQNSFLLNWGCQLLKDNQEEWKTFPQSYFKNLGGLSIFESKINFKDFEGKYEIKSIFWRKVLQTWIESNISEDNITTLDTINNNRYLTLNNKPILIKNATANSIIYIKDMLKENRELITFKEYNEKIGNHPSNLIDYVTIKTAINKIKCKLVYKTRCKDLTFRDKKIECLNRKNLYKLLIQNKTCLCENFWERKLGKKINEKTWSNIFSCTKETKLQEFQWKIVHNIFPTNILLSKIGIKDTEKCEICGVTDYIEHLFIECQRIGSYWNVVETMINSKLSTIIKLNNTIILLGIEQDEQCKRLNKKEISMINEILIIAKLSISKSKINDLKIELVFENEIRIRNKNEDETTRNSKHD